MPIGRRKGVSRRAWHLVITQWHSAIGDWQNAGTDLVLCPTIAHLGRFTPLWILEQARIDLRMCGEIQLAGVVHVHVAPG